MSQSPLKDVADPGKDYLGAFGELSQRIREGQSFSGGERNCAFLNRGGGRFVDLSYALGLDAAEDGRGIALSDFDADGDVDICITSRTAPRLRLLRNDLLAGNRTIALKLVGDPAKFCPRDAIGARVEVAVGGETRHRTLAAGDGFASQSSKWITVGLGADGELGGVSVRWPGGGREQFSGVEVGGRYVLRQGAGIAQGTDLSPTAPLAVDEVPLPAPTELARIRLSQPLKLPASLDYERLDGKRAGLLDLASDRKLLINLWATWCAPCVAELAAFENAAADLRGAGVEVIALSVDGLEGDGVAGDVLRRALAQSGFSGEIGLADDKLVAAFERLILQTVYHHRRLPVPTSFLIDKGGWLTVIYKGAVDVERVLADAKKLGLGPDIAQRESLPFAGVWAEKQFASHPLAIAGAYRRAEYLDDAKATLERFLAENPVRPGSRMSAKQSAQLADVHFELGEIHAQADDRRAALRQFKAAVHFNARSERYRLRKVIALAEAGEIKEAQLESGQLRLASPANPNVLALCGDVARLAGDPAAAVEAYAATLKVDPRYIPALYDLAKLRATSKTGSVRDAAEAVRLMKFLMNAPGANTNPEFIVTQAAAFAEAGNWSPAVARVEDAIAIARANGDAALLDRLRPILEQFRSEKPLRID